MEFYLETFVLVVGIALVLMGKVKKKPVYLGIGIGLLLANIVLGIPHFVKGFSDGFDG